MRLAYRYLPAPDEPDAVRGRRLVRRSRGPRREPASATAGPHGCRRDPHRPRRRGAAPRVPARVALLRRPVLRVDGARRAALVLAARTDTADAGPTFPSATRSWHARPEASGCLTSTSSRTSPGGTRRPSVHPATALYDVDGFKPRRRVRSPTIERRRAWTARRRGHDPAAPAVPLRPRHAELGAPRRHRHRRRLLGRGGGGGAPAGRRRRPAPARPLHPVRTSTTSRTVLDGQLRRRLQLLGRAHLARRPASAGRDVVARYVRPGGGLLPRRVPPRGFFLIDDERTRRRAAPDLPVLPGAASRTAGTRPAIVRRPAGGT